MQDKFLQATKTKLRFHTETGHLSTEDLWDIPLKKLDELAVAIDSTLTGERKSFLANPDRKAAEAQLVNALRLDILKEVIETKQTENAAKLAAADKRARKEFLEKLLEKKQIDQLESLSAEEIQKELAALQG